MKTYSHYEADYLPSDVEPASDASVCLRCHQPINQFNHTEANCAKYV